MRAKILALGFIIIFFSIQINEGPLYLGFFFILGVWIRDMVSKKRFIFPRTSLDPAFSAFFITALFSTLYSMNFYQSLQTTLFVSFLVILSYYLLVLYLDKGNLRRIFITLAISCTLSSTYGIFNYFFRNLERAHAFFHYGPLDATYLTFIIPLFISRLLFTDSRREKLYLGLPLLSSLFFLALTYTRSSWLGIVAVTLALTWLKSRKAFLFLLLVILLLFLVLPYVPSSRIVDRGKSIFDLSEWGDRRFVWEGALNMVRDRPLSGIGFNTFEEVYNNRGKYYGYKPSQAKEITSHAHYLFLNIAAEMGIPSLLAFLWLVIALSREAIASFRRCKDPYLRSLIAAVLGGLLSYLIFVGGGIMIRNNLLIIFWSTFGLLGAIGKLSAAPPDRPGRRSNPADPHRRHPPGTPDIRDRLGKEKE